MELHPYQKEGVDFLLHHNGGLLLDEQGLGKTIQTLFAIRSLLERTSSAPDALLVVCPAVMQATWKTHIAAILKPFRGSVKILIHSYEWYSKEDNLKSVILRIRKSYPKIAIIVDESHYIKTPTSKRTKSVLALLSLPQTVFKVLLTGTPITRDIDDLFTQLRPFYPDTPPFNRSIYEFRKRFMKCIHTFFGDQYKGFSSEYSKQVLTEFLRQVSLRRTKRTAGINLPPVLRTPVYIDINKKVAEQSLTLLDYATKVINGQSYNDYKTNLEEESTHIATIRKALGVAKIPQTIQYIQTLVDANITKLIIFAVHIDVVSLLQESLAKKFSSYTVHKVTGATSTSQRNKIFESFQNEEKPQIIVANMVACGVGVTLTSAHTVVFAEIDFTPSNIMQAEARVHRITQTEPVNSVFILANDSLDVKIMGLIRSKINIIKQTLKGD